jgi:acetylornithine/N-succinyldiaminopimelate aminotransferase
VNDALMPTYARSDLAFEHGEGAYLITADGRRYLDFAGGIAVNSLGHSHPHLVTALQNQAGKLWHVSNLYDIPDSRRLAARLAEVTFADQVFFCNSGAEAVECALKVARRYHHARGESQRRRVITCSGAFHGRTLTTLSAAANPKYLEGFGTPSADFDQVSFNNLNELRNAIGAETAAILVEPIQGEGGIRPADPDFLKGLRAACDEFGLLLIYDEVQCGMGRSGKLFAYEWSGAAPDIMAVAKGLGGGFPVGACLANAQAAEAMVAGTHGSTFGGNPLAMAVGNAVLDVMLAPGFFDNVNRQGEALRVGLADLAAKYPKVISGVRGQGLMLGVSCVVPSGDMVVALRREGLLSVGAAENILRLLPPLIIGDREVAAALAIFEKVCSGLRGAS